MKGQLWVAILVSILLEYKITLLFDHIAGVTNVIADGLSRFNQAHRLNLEQRGFRSMTMPDLECRKDIWKGSSADFWIEGAQTLLWHI